MSQIMDVVVIGCGASGVAALRRLHDAGLKVMGLEANDRVGGRICSVPFANGYVDLGAAWCHGEKNNKVFELVNKLDLLGRPHSEEMKCFVYNGTSSNEAEKIIEVLQNAVAESDKNNAKSFSECLRDAVNSRSDLPKDSQLINAAVEWYERNNHVGGQNDPRTGKSLKGVEEHWPCEGEFWLNWKGKGFKTVLDVLLNRYPDPSKEIPVQILLNKEVEIIKWRSNEDQVNPLVHVKCKDGSLYAAKSVIVTVSLAVLKERHNELFNPPLPVEKVNSINNLNMTILGKIYIEFEKSWWPAKRSNFIVFWREEDKAKFSADERWVTEIHGIQTVEHQPYVLLVWIYGNGAEEMEKVSSEGVKAGVLKLFNRMLSHYEVSPIRNILRTQWTTNPLVRGTYSYRSVASELTGANAIVLSEPLFCAQSPVVCFAGEATSHHYHNAVHGAIDAGFREADRLIDALGRSKQS